MKKLQPMKKLLNKSFILCFLALGSIFTIACFSEPPQPEKEPPFGSKSADITPTPKVELTEFESELKSMRIADFYYIFTLKRKDGGVFDSKDKAFVNANKHYATNRFSFVEDDKTLFIGTNYEFTEENIEALKERFDFENFSKSDEEIEKEKQKRREEREAYEKEAGILRDENSNTSENSAN